jgi:hypothetical protein
VLFRLDDVSSMQCRWLEFHARIRSVAFPIGT